MSFVKLRTKHIELVEAVNNATTRTERNEADAKLRGYRKALEITMGDAYGWELMACDQHYIDQGYEGDMCCGIKPDSVPA